MVDLCSFCCKPLKIFRVTKTFYSSRFGTFSLDFCSEQCVLDYEKNVSVGDRRPSNEDLEKIAIKRVT